MATRLEIIQRNFLWGTSKDEFKYPFAWKKGCLLVEASGLGIRRIGLFNQALLGKWLWYFGIEVNFLWHQVIGKLEGEGALELLGHMAVGCGTLEKVLWIFVGCGRTIPWHPLQLPPHLITTTEACKWKCQHFQDPLKAYNIHANQHDELVCLSGW